MFVSTIPFRYHVDFTKTTIQLICDVASCLKVGYYHQRYPYNHLVKDLQSIFNEYEN